MLAAGLAAASVVVLALAYQPGAPDRAYMGTDARAFEPLLGAMAAALLRLEPVRAWVDRRARRLTWGGLAVVVAGVALLGAPDGPRPGYFAGGALVVALGGAALITAAGAATACAGSASSGSTSGPLLPQPASAVRARTRARAAGRRAWRRQECGLFIRAV